MTPVNNVPFDEGGFIRGSLLQLPELVGQSCARTGLILQILLVSREPLFECVACTSIVSAILILGRHGSRVGESFSQAFSFNWAGGSLAVASWFSLAIQLCHFSVVTGDVASNITGARVGEADCMPIEVLVPSASFWEILVQDAEKSLSHVCLHLEVVWWIVPEGVGVSSLPLACVWSWCLLGVLQSDFVSALGKGVLVESFVLVKHALIGAPTVQPLLDCLRDVPCNCPWVV